MEPSGIPSWREQSPFHANNEAGLLQAKLFKATVHTLSVFLVRYPLRGVKKEDTCNNHLKNRTNRRLRNRNSLRSRGEATVVSPRQGDAPRRAATVSGPGNASGRHTHRVQMSQGNGHLCAGTSASREPFTCPLGGPSAFALGFLYKVKMQNSTGTSTSTFTSSIKTSRVPRPCGACYPKNPVFLTLG